MVISCSSIGKSFGETRVLNQVSFHINENEKAAIVGVNGAGKSTLLKILAGELSPDEGQVTMQKDARIGYLSQHPDLTSGKTIYDEVLDGKRDLLLMEETLQKMEHEMGSLLGDALARASEEYHVLLQKFTDQNGYALRSEVRGVLKGLGFAEEDFTKICTKLSGGQKTRVALAKMLLSYPEILLLDEPTNHLDMDSIRWLENFLMGYKGTVIIVAHDRYFLDRVVGKVIGISHHKAMVYSGNYTDYARKAAAQRLADQRAWENQQQKIRHEKQVIDKLKSFNREKSVRRAESREKMLDRMEMIEKPKDENTAMRLTITPAVTSGKDVLDIEGLAKSFGENHLFSDINISIKRGEHVALIGANGTGKTTILKILNGKETADAGTIRLGTNVEIGYYDQEQQELCMEKTILDEIWDAYPNLNETTIRNTLAAFLFTGDVVYRQVAALSGGERGRLSLAKLMLSDANFLILDEPTNHLDMESREILEDALKSYEGTVLFVSHDRYFINKSADRILHLDHRQIRDFHGNYDYYLEKCREEENRMAEVAAGGNAKLQAGAADTAQVKADAGKADWKEQKAKQAEIRKKENRLRAIEEAIMQTEEAIEAIEAQYVLPEVATNSARLNELSAQQKELNDQLEKLYAEWESLED